MPVREQSKLLSRGAGDDLGTVVSGLRSQATVLKSSPAPRVNSIRLFHVCSGNSQNYSATALKSSPAPRDNSFDCSLNRHEITVLLSYIHAHNHKSTEDDNVSIPYH
jgi:hypothetical protein